MDACCCLLKLPCDHDNSTTNTFANVCTCMKCDMIRIRYSRSRYVDRLHALCVVGMWVEKPIPHVHVALQSDKHVVSFRKAGIHSIDIDERLHTCTSGPSYVDAEV